MSGGLFSCPLPEPAQTWYLYLRRCISRQLSVLPAPTPELFLHHKVRKQTPGVLQKSYKAHLVLGEVDQFSEAFVGRTRN